MHRDNEAVSPVIATVLLLAITVLLSSMVFIMMSSTFDSVEKDDPKASFRLEGYLTDTMLLLLQASTNH